MLLPILSPARKVAKNFGGSDNSASNAKTTNRRLGSVRLFAILPVLLMMIATILAVLCVFAGSKPGMMDDYAVFTLNTSRIGENIRNELDSKINSINLKRSAPATPPTITAAPTTTITMAPRGIVSDITSLETRASSVIHSAASVISSKATSVESAVASEATSALASAKTDVINIVNKVFNGVVSELNLTDFYAIHISTTCQGTYAFKNGTDIVVGNSSLPTKGTHEKVASCSSHSAIDPMSLVKILYWIGIIFTAAAFLLGIAGIVLTSRKIALYNVIGSVPAFCFMLLASAVTHGISVGAAHLVNFVGEDVGIQGSAGQKFLTLSWTTTCLILVNMGIWSLLFVLRGRSSQDAAPAPVTSGGWGSRSMRRRPDRTSAVLMETISQPVRPAKVRDERGVSMI